MTDDSYEHRHHYYNFCLNVCLEKISKIERQYFYKSDIHADGQSSVKTEAARKVLQRQR